MIEHGSFTFTCSDKRGVQHQYECQHPKPMEGYRLSMRITSMCTTPLITTLGKHLAGTESDSKKVVTQILNSGTGTLQQMLDGVLMSDAHFELAPELLAYCKRDGIALDNEDALKAAYEGNYAEIQEAMIKVIQGNGLSPRVATLLAVFKPQNSSKSG